MAWLHTAGALGAMALGAAVFAQTPWLRYDASMGTLPTQQGFAARDDGRSAAPIVRGGALEQGPTDMTGMQYYSAGHEIRFTDGVVVEAEIDVRSSTLNVNNCASGVRTGYYLGVVDDVGRFAYIAISSTHLAVLTSVGQMPTTETPLFPVPMTTGWRTLKMVIRERGVDLFVDGNFVGTSALGPAGQARDRNRFLFGDGTTCGASTTRLRWAQVSPYVPCLADFNEDGFVDFIDYDDFVMCFEGVACPAGKTADVNGDGFVDFFDYDDFVAAFKSGCGANPEGDGPGGGVAE